MAERRITRRQLLERIAGSARPRPWRRSSRPAQPPPPRQLLRPPHPPQPAPLGRPRRRGGHPIRPADAGPDPGGRAPHLELGRVHGRGRHPVVREEVPRQGQLGLLRHVRGDVREGHRGKDRLRHHVPRLDRCPGPRDDRQGPAARPDPHPQRGEPGARMGEPWLRPGQQELDALHVVDDRSRLRHEADQGGADQLEGPLGRALEGPHRDARRPAGGVRSRAHPAQLQRQHGRRHRAGSGTRAAQATASARSPVQRRRSAVHELRATSGSATRGARTSTPSSRRSRRSSSTSPRRVRSAARTRRSSSMAPRTRSRRTCSSTTCSTRRSARTTRITSGTWGRTWPPGSTSARTSWTRPWINPDKAIVDKLQELLDLGLDTDKYASRWTELKAGI